MVKQVGPQTYLFAGTAMNVLDDWLPIAVHLQSMNSKAKFEMLIPFSWILKSDNLKDLEVISEELVSCVYVADGANARVYPSLAIARQSMKGQLWAKLLRSRGFGGQIDISSALWQRSRTLLFDWTHHAAEGPLGDWFLSNSFASCVAICHGPVPDFTDQADAHGPNRRHFSAGTWEKTLFIGSNAVRFPGDARHIAVGIPRHSPSWQAYLRSRFGFDGSGHTVLFSRPPDDYPRRFQTQQVREFGYQVVRDATQRLGHHLLIKRHPHEIDGWSPLEVTNFSAADWSWSQTSSMSLLQSVSLAALFQSMVALDSIAAGSIAISLRRWAWNATGNQGNFHETFLESQGLVLEVDSRDALVNAIRLAPNDACRIAQSRYENLIGPLSAESGLAAATAIMGHCE